MLFLFSLKIFFILEGFSGKLKDIDARVVKLEKEYFQLKTKFNQIESRFKMMVNQLSNLNNREKL